MNPVYKNGVEIQLGDFIWFHNSDGRLREGYVRKIEKILGNEEAIWSDWSGRKQKEWKDSYLTWIFSDKIEGYEKIVTNVPKVERTYFRLIEG